MSDSGVSENDVAIVGMSLRVPGAWTVDRFWQNLTGGVESMVELSEEELLEAGESPELLRHPDYVRACGPLEGMELFDGEFFGFSPKESAILDPQHRHFTECCWEALEDAGHPPEKFEGQVGVFAGCGMGSYFYFNVCTNKELVDSVGLFLLRHTGNDKDFLTTRVSYLLDLKGPSVNIQTACSTSLVATHAACQSLLSGECDLALAGGSTILFPHRRGYVYQEGEVLSPDGHCHAFDHRAAGTVLASGAAVVALRRLEDALEDGDPIYAVIKGTAVNNDGGQKVGYLAPSVDGQTAAMVEAHEVADVDPATIGMIECHGTGTYMGDPIEISALTNAFRRTTEDNGFCRIGSVKTNIGHLDTAAGVVGMMKAALSLEREAIPPSLNYERPNPVIGFESTPFVVNDTLTPWPRTSAPRRAAVNSLGVGGTNAHAVLEEPPARETTSTATRPFQLLTLSARNNKSLDGAAKKLAAWLREHPDVPLADVAYTLDVGRRAFDRRRVLAVASHEEAIEYLESGDPRRVFTHGVPNTDASIAFMFSGAGSQYPRMAAELYEQEPVFREHLDRGLTLLEEKTGFDFRQLFFAENDRLEEAREELEHTNRMLAAIFVTEYALAKLWMSWGIEPEILVGHSLGENTAACIAGVMSFEDCLDLVILRGRLTDEVAPGAMTSVLMAPESLRPLLEGDVDLAIVNGPELCVISGSASGMEEVEKRLSEHEVEFTRLPIPRAGHSRMFDPILPAFRSFLESIELHPPQIPFVSNRTGKLITDEQATSPEYWVDHLRNTVFFADCLGTVLEKPGRVLIEVGPGQNLSSLARQHPAARTANVVPSMRHRDDSVSDAAYFLVALGRVWASGVDVDFERLREGETRRRVRLPTYAWSHQPYFIEATAPAAVGPDLTQLERLENLRDWAYRPAWPVTPATPAAESKPQTWLLFMDEDGVGRRLRKRLQARGHTVVSVFQGDAYYKRSDDEYSLAPERGRTGYDALVQDLVASGRVPSQIVHLWLVTGRERFRPGSSFFHQNLQDGFYSLFFLAQSLGDESVPRPLHISVVSNGAHSTGPADPVRYPEKATALGPVKVIPRELPGVTCKSIDVVLPARPESTVAGLLQSIRGAKDGFDLDSVADLLERELLAEPENDVVAHRGEERRVRRFEKHLLEAPVDGTKSALREGGTYLITGGLGGLGLTLADRLASEIRPKLVLVGRTGLPPREDWADWVAQRGESDRISRCIRRVQQLEASGAEVLALAADVTNLEQMREAVRQAREAFGSIHGIFHTAGRVKDELIQLKLESDVEEVFGAKIHGTLVLDALLEESGAELLVLYSSTSAIAAPAGQIDYVAANAFLDAYAASARRSGVRTVAVNWGIWNQVGMAAESFESGGAEEAEGETPREPTHPLFETRAKDAHGRTAFHKTYTAAGDWVLDQHRTTTGHALLPGTGYPELAQGALREYGAFRGDGDAFEIRDLYFMSPLYVPDSESRDVRVMLTPSDAGYRFEVRTGCRLDGRPAWELNAQASLELGRRTRPDPVDLQAIFDRCHVSRSGDHPEGLRSGQENHVRFGPRWRVLREVAYGEGEALARLELPDEFASDLEQGYGLHPALLDYATGYAMDLIRGYEGKDLWVPVSYGKIAVFGPLPQRVHSWVRNHGDNGNDREFAVFDVTITDPQGNVLLDIDQFTIKRLDEAVDFAGGHQPSRSDCEFEAALGSGDARNLSPAELQLRRNYERGIRPEEGSEALVRVLAGEPHAQVAVSSLDLPSLVAQAELAAQQSAGGGQSFARPDLDSEYVEPRDELERTLVGFWEELLGVDQVGVADSFFELGGHSLIAVRLFAMIKKAYHVEFPISVLFEAPTIEGCAQLIRDARGDVEEGAEGASAPASETRRSRFKYLVAMHEGEGGPKTPFFLVAGMFGNVLNLRHLASLCGTDRPFYGVQARGLYGDEPPHETFEEMAEAYIEEMKQVQPEGPYFVGGFSGGGLTAFEIAHQLRAAGDEVGLLLLLDSRLPQTPDLTFLDRAKVQWIRLQQRGPGYAVDWARNRMKWQIEQIQARFAPEEAVGHTADQFHNQEIEAAFRAALPRYQMKKWPGHMVLFRPKLDEAYVLGPGRVLDSMKEWVSHDNAFGPYCESLEIHEMPGDHDSMVLEPNVRVMAERLRECIAKAESEGR